MFPGSIARNVDRPDRKLRTAPAHHIDPAALWYHRRNIAMPPALD